jgi:hypothetical protein
LTFAQATELTWPQLMHAMGVNRNAASDRDAADRISAEQHAVFDRIVDRRQCLPIDLLRMPMADLMAQIKMEIGGQTPPVEVLSIGLARYVAERSGGDQVCAAAPGRVHAR